MKNENIWTILAIIGPVLMAHATMSVLPIMRAPSSLSWAILAAESMYLIGFACFFAHRKNQDRKAIQEAISNIDSYKEGGSLSHSQKAASPNLNRLCSLIQELAASTPVDPEPVTEEWEDRETRFFQEHDGRALTEIEIRFSAQNPKMRACVEDVLNKVFPSAITNWTEERVLALVVGIDSEQELAGKKEEIIKLCSEAVPSEPWQIELIRDAEPEATSHDIDHSWSGRTNAVPPKEQMEDILSKVQSTMEFGTIGVAVKKEGTAQYEYLIESQMCPASLSAEKAFAWLPEDALKQECWGISSREYLPEWTKVCLEECNIQAMYLIPFDFRGRPIGFLYLIADEHTPLTTADYRKAMEIHECLKPSLFQFLMERGEKKLNDFCTLVHARFGIMRYVIDAETFLLKSVSDPHFKFKDKVKCHEAFFGRSSPCPYCPVSTGLPMEEVAPMLGPEKMTFDLLNKGDPAMTSLIITSAETMPFDTRENEMERVFEHEIVNQFYGCLLCFRLETPLSGMRDEVHKFVRGKMEGIGFDYNLCRYGEDAFVLVLRNMDVDESTVLATEVFQALRMETGIDIAPRLSWSFALFRYPEEVRSFPAFETMFRKTMARANEAGRNRMLSLPHCPAMSFSERAYDAQKYLIKGEETHLKFDVIHECKSRIPRFVIARADISSFSLLKTDPQRIYDTIFRGPLGLQASNQFLQKVETFLWRNLKRLRTYSLKGFLIEVPRCASINEEWVNRLAYMIRLNHCPQNFLQIRFLEEEQPSSKVIDRLRRLSIPYIQDENGAFGLRFLRENAISAIGVSETAYFDLKDTIRKNKGVEFIARIQNRRERDFATMLEIPYAMGPYYEEPFSESALFQRIKQSTN